MPRVQRAARRARRGGDVRDAGVVGDQQIEVSVIIDVASGELLALHGKLELGHQTERLHRRGEGYRVVQATTAGGSGFPADKLDHLFMSESGSMLNSFWALILVNTAFQIGFLIFLPFLIIDIVISSTLMSMGMMMLPPIFISLPFKILLFVLVDGWNLVTGSIVRSFGT